MQKAIWALAIVCCLSTITLTVAITHADSPPSMPNELRTTVLVLVNEKGETTARLFGRSEGYANGLGIVLGNEHDTGITLMCAPAGALMITAQDGRRKSRADFHLDTNGSSSFSFSGNDGSARVGLNAISPFINLQNADGTYLNLHTHNGMLFSGGKNPVGPTIKSSIGVELTTKTSKE